MRCELLWRCCGEARRECTQAMGVAAGAAVSRGDRAEGWTAERAGLLKVRRLERPVVSVGSISAGGAGKTPVVISLAKMLRARGWDVDVLSRGYGRIGHGVEWVAAMGDRAAERYGDEPVVIARATGVPVWVSGNRFAAGRAAESGVAGEVRGANGNHNHDQNHVNGEG